MGETALIVVGAACVVAAAVGGGVDAAGWKIPVISTLPRQIIVGVVGVALIVAGWTSGRGGQDNAQNAAPNAAASKAKQADAELQPLLDFAHVQTDLAPDRRIAAAPILYGSVVPIRLGEVAPQGSRLLFVRASDEYEGTAIQPTRSDVVLMLDVPHVEPSRFTLEFESPLRAIGFVIPGFFPATKKNGIVIPAFQVTAFGPDGELVDQQGRALRRAFVPVATEAIVLRAQAGSAIKRVEFRNDPEGIAAFRAVPIEALTYSLAH